MIVLGSKKSGLWTYRTFVLVLTVLHKNLKGHLAPPVHLIVTKNHHLRLSVCHEKWAVSHIVSRPVQLGPPVNLFVKKNHHLKRYVKASFENCSELAQELFDNTIQDQLSLGLSTMKPVVIIFHGGVWRGASTRSGQNSILFVQFP